MDRSFQLIPAIDLMDGQCVRLTHGRAEQKRVYSDNPAEMARSFEMSGADRIHIVDLDGAFSGKPANFKAIQAIRERVGAKLEIGGGLREAKDLESVFKIGVEYAILGTSAVENMDFLKSMLDLFGEKIIVGIDAHNGKVAIKGWVEIRDLGALEWAAELQQAGVKTIVYTDIATDGALSGPNLPAQREMAESTSMSVIASGGIASLDDVKDLAGLPCANLVGAIAGKSIYDGKLDLAQTFEALRST